MLTLPPLIASINYVVPDLAMVPSCPIRSFLVIPIPESVIVTVFSSLLPSILILRSLFVSSYSGCSIERYLILSRASEAFEINSLKKISFSV